MVARCEVKPFLSVLSLKDSAVIMLKGDPQKFAGIYIVFDDQYVHGNS
jgi:hypothetical protein